MKMAWASDDSTMFLSQGTAGVVSGRCPGAIAHMKIVRGHQIATFLEALGIFRIEIFREYPYLYDGDMDYERRYLSRYLRTPESILAVMSDGAAIQAACTGLPFSYEDGETQEPFAGEDFSQIYYIGEVMVRPGLRGKGIGSTLLKTVLALIDHDKYQTVCLYTVDRGVDHPHRHEGYRPPDSIWQRFGFAKDEKRKACYRWKDIGQQSETDKTMSVWARKR